MTKQEKIVCLTATRYETTAEAKTKLYALNEQLWHESVVRFVKLHRLRNMIRLYLVAARQICNTAALSNFSPEVSVWHNSRTSVKPISA